jgi:small subunit ribosomal protein S6
MISIFRPGLGEDAVNAIVENTRKIIEDDQGTVISLTRWGMKKLAYPIKKEKQGLYYFYEYAASPAAITEIERKFRIDDGVLKYLTVKIADDIGAAELAVAIADSDKRNAAFLRDESSESGETSESGEGAESAAVTETAVTDGGDGAAGTDSELTTDEKE